MAATRLISMHQNKGKSIAQCLSDRTDYAKTPTKPMMESLLALMNVTLVQCRENLCFPSVSTTR